MFRGGRSTWRSTRSAPGRVCPRQPAGGDGPGDVQAVSPHHHASQAVASGGVQMIDDFTRTIQYLHPFIDPHAAFGGHGPRFRGPEQVKRPLGKAVTPTCAAKHVGHDAHCHPPQFYSALYTTHPDDPPLPVFRGVEHAPHRLEGLARLVEEFDSPNNGLLFCIGTMAEAGEDVIEGLRRFAQRGQIFYVHYRNVRGTAPHYQEVFQDEGDVDMVAALRVLKDVGFDGWVVNDHEPMLDGDTRQWSPRSLAWQVGYIRGVLQSVG